MKARHVAADLAKLLQDAARETGKELQFASNELRVYVAERIAHLATIVGQPGYDEAFLAERDAVLLKTGVLATNKADAADQRIIGIITGVMSVGARAIVL